MKRYGKSRVSVTPKLIIKDFFDSLGYLNNRLDSLSNDTFIISPGKRSLIISEQIECSVPLDFTFPHKTYPCYYDAGDISARTSEIGGTLARKGYPFARTIIEIMPVSSIHDSLTVIFNIYPDLKYRFTSPLLEGNFKTKKRLLLKDIKIKEGDLFNIDRVEESAENLRSRQYIANVQARAPLIIKSSPQIPNQDDTLTAVPFLINDRSGMGLEGALGFDASQGNQSTIQGDIKCSFLNLLHSGEAAAFSYSGTKVSQKLDASVSKPWLFNLPLEFLSDMGMEIERDNYGYIYGRVRLLYELNPFWKAGIGFKGNEITYSSDTIDVGSGKFYGVDFVLSKIPPLYCLGLFGSELFLETGSGVSKKEKNYTRSHIDFSAGVHVPYLTKFATFLKLTSKHIVSDEKNLAPAEMYRVGGYNSIRGYSDDAFACRTALYGQIENLLYFSKSGSVYIFLDGGIGFQQSNDFLNGNHISMLGYGAGVRLPSKLGSMSLEWARNIQDKRSLGRIHIRFQNAFSSLLDKF